MEPFYDSDEEIAWGPVTLREIKGDLKRPVLRKPERRHTVFNNFHKDHKRITTELPTENIPHLHEELSTKLDISGTSTAYFTPNETFQTESNVDFLEKLSKVINEPQSDLSAYASALDSTKASDSTNKITKTSLLLNSETRSANIRDTSGIMNKSGFTNIEQENVPYNFQSTETLVTPYLSVVDDQKHHMNNTCLNFVKNVVQQNTQYDIANFHQTLVQTLVVSEDEQQSDDDQYSDKDQSVDEIYLREKHTSTIQEDEEIVVISDTEQSLIIMEDVLDEGTQSFNKERKSDSLISGRVQALCSSNSDSEKYKRNEIDEDSLENSTSSEQNPYDYKNVSVEDIVENNCNLTGQKAYIKGSQVTPIREKVCMSTSPIEVPQFDFTQFDSHEDSQIFDDTMEEINRIPQQDIRTNNYNQTSQKGYIKGSQVTPIREKVCISTSPIEVPELDLTQFDSNDDSQIFDDTMEEVNRILQQGVNYMSDKNEIIEATSKNEALLKQPLIISGSFSQSASVSINKERVSPTPQKNIHPTSAKKMHVDRPKQKMTSSAQFRVPEVPPRLKLTSPLPPKTYHSNLKNVVSPVALYIKNSPRVPLKKNIPQRELPLVIKPSTSKVLCKENNCEFPTVSYKPSKSPITTKQKPMIIPPSLKKLNVRELVITKHERRIKQNFEKVEINRNLLENDITNNSIDPSMLNNSSDISVLTEKHAFIK